MKSKIVASGALFAALCATTAMAQPQRVKPYVENDNRFDLAKVKLTQLNPTGEAWLVTSEGGATFDRADLQDGVASPWRMKAEFECPAGDPPSPDKSFITADGEIDELNLQTIGFEDLMSYGDDDVFPGALAGEVFTTAWTGDYAQEHWLDNETAFAIEACNAAAVARRAQNPAMSMKVAMSKVGVIYPYAALADNQNVAGRARLKARCTQAKYEMDGGAYVPDGEFVWEGQTEFLKLKLPVKCKAPLAPVKPASDRFSAGFGVTSATLEAEPVFAKGQCPRAVTFKGAFEASGAGQVRYRVRGSDGALGRVNSINVSSAAPTPFSFTREFGKKSTGGLVAPTDPTPSRPGDLAIPGPTGDPKGPTLKAPQGSGGGTSPAAPGSVAVATAEGEHSGWMRVEIVSPTAGVKKSSDAFYKVICREQTLPEGVAVRGSDARKKPSVDGAAKPKP